MPKKIFQGGGVGLGGAIVGNKKKREKGREMMERSKKIFFF